MAARTGTKHHNAKLTTAKVRAARKAHAKVNKDGRHPTIKALAEKYGVANQTMWAVIHGKTWKSVS